MSDKYQNEIEEILKRAEEVLPQDTSIRSVAQPRGSGRFFKPENQPGRGRGLKFSATKLMLASFAMLLLALILGAFKVMSVLPLVVVGLILFVIAYALFFVRPGSSYEKRWRGRLIEERPTIWDRVKSWLSG